MATIQVLNTRFENIEAILFDKDGTLEDPQEFLRLLCQKRARLIDAQIPGIGEPLLMAFGMQGNQLDPTGLMAVGSRGECEIAAAAYIAETGRGWLEALSIARQAFLEADRTLPPITPSPLFVGSLEVLKFLSEAGIRLGILSAASTERVQAFVRHHQLTPYLQLEMGVDGTLSKPDPRLFLQACERLGVKPDRTLMVGDSAGDIQMAKNAGAAGGIGICWGSPQVAHLETADVTIGHLEAIHVL